MEESVRWEYLIIQLDNYTGEDLEQIRRDNQMHLDSFGLEGWELVTVRKDLAYLKRPFVKKANPEYIDQEQFEKLREHSIG